MVRAKSPGRRAVHHVMPDVRNRGEYEGDLYVDERLVADLIQACKVVAATLDTLPSV